MLIELFDQTGVVLVRVFDLICSVYNATHVLFYRLSALGSC